MIWTRKRREQGSALAPRRHVNLREGLEVSGRWPLLGKFSPRSRSQGQDVLDRTNRKKIYNISEGQVRTRFSHCPSTMQTQYYGVPPGPFHSDPYNQCVQGVLQPAFPNQYGTILGGGGFIGDFSRGSPFAYPHPEYAYFPDRGGPSTTIPSTSLAVSSLDATGLGFTGNPSGTDLFLQPEDIAEYAQESWQWTGQPCHGLGPLATPAHIAHVHPEPDFFEVDKSSGSLVESGVCSPTAQLPTPAAMAVLLNHKARPERRHEEGSSSTGVAPPPPLPVVDTTPHAHQNETVAISPPRPVPDRSDILSREKKHACTMCDQFQCCRFDRPSTLRKVSA